MLGREGNEDSGVHLGSQGHVFWQAKWEILDSMSKTTCRPCNIGRRIIVSVNEERGRDRLR